VPTRDYWGVSQGGLGVGMLV